MSVRTAKKQAFDCVAMMHDAQERIHRELEGKTIEEELAFWRGSSARLRARLAQDKQREKTRSSAAGLERE